MKSTQVGASALFALASFLAAELLFSAQPMIGKMVLPFFGGTPAVWNTCLVYFQASLLCGYLLAHAIFTALARKQRGVSTLVLSGLAALLALGYVVQPIGIEPAIGKRLAVNNQAALELLWALVGSATLPLLIVSASAPLLQSWFTCTDHPRAHDPYFLYAASNAGSLLALLSYPFAVEPNLGLANQSQVWRSGFLMLGVLLLCCGIATRRLAGSQGAGTTARSPALLPSRNENRLIPALATHLTLAARFRWIALVFITSSWLMGVTTYLTTDIASIPLLWTIPLALYLLSFILAFAWPTSRAVVAAGVLLPNVVVPIVLVMSAGFAHALWIPLHLMAFLLGSVACHGALARARPPAQYATTFYITIAIGGLLGGIWNALVAPLVFNRIVEYPMAIVLACLVGPGVLVPPMGRTRTYWLGDLLLPAVVFLLTLVLATNQGGLADSALGAMGVMAAAGLGFYACVTAGRRPVRFALVLTSVLAASGLAPGASGRLLHIERDFFGVVRVTQDAQADVHRLFHGSTLHGQQSCDPALRREPSTYFTRAGPIGQLFETLKPRSGQRGARIAILGLGAGTLASYARPDERWTFYEIDAAVVRIARDSRFFTYLADCQARSLEVVLGDARLQIASAPDHAYRLIVLDAFSSDAVPVHLISREALQLYRAKLASGGVLAFNLSNRYLDLDPVMARQAQDADLVYRVRYDLQVSDEEKRAGKQPSIWAVMAATEGDLGGLVADPRWRPAAPRPRSTVWTDDYSDLASYLIFTPRRTEARSRKEGGIVPRN